MPIIHLIKNDSAGNPEYDFRLPNFRMFEGKVDTPVTPAPLPEEGADENILTKISGNTANYTIAWIIKESDTNDEVLAGIRTRSVYEKINFLEETFVSESIEDSFTLLINDDDDSTQLLKREGITTKFTYSVQEDSPLAFIGSIDMIRGRAIVVREYDVPSEPLSFSVTKSSTRRMRLTWETPRIAGSSSITSYQISYQKIGQDVVKITHNSTTSLLRNITVGTSGIYAVHIRAENRSGLGAKSVEKTITL